MLAAKEGDRRAIQALVSFYWRSVARVAAAILLPSRGDGDVEDVVIDVFDYFLANELASFDPSLPTPLSAFLHQKVRWLAYDRLRQRAEARLPSDPPAPTPDPERDATSRQEFLQTAELFDSMPDSQREVVVLRLLGHSYRQIADQVGKSVPAVRGLIHRGLLFLRRAASLRSSDAGRTHNGRRHQ